jgi:hypothetical protein
VSEWDDPVPAHPVRWRGIDFDSKLELSWAVTLDHYGFYWTWHPGAVGLAGGGWWEPDALIGEVLAEVKPWAGESVDRLWKPHRAWELHQLPVLILRPGLVPADAEIEQAGLDWESVDGQEWVIAFDESSACFLPLHVAEKTHHPSRVRFAASAVGLSPERVGVPMRHWSEAETHGEV